MRFFTEGLCMLWSRDCRIIFKAEGTWAIISPTWGSWGTREDLPKVTQLPCGRAGLESELLCCKDGSTSLMSQNRPMAHEPCSQCRETPMCATPEGGGVIEAHGGDTEESASLSSPSVHVNPKPQVCHWETQRERRCWWTDSLEAE